MMSGKTARCRVFTTHVALLLLNIFSGCCSFSTQHTCRLRLLSKPKTNSIVAKALAFRSKTSHSFAGRITPNVSARTRLRSSNDNYDSLGGAYGGGDGMPRRPSSPAKTYDKAAQTPIRDLIDTEAAMNAFFTSREEWTPLFRSMIMAASSNNGDDGEASNDGINSRIISCQASGYLGDMRHGSDDDGFDWMTTPGPWCTTLNAIPTDDGDRQVIAGFLDSMHQSLLDIPVTESKDDDENDIQFMEEGRRMLAISRFHVLRTNSNGNKRQMTTDGVESYDKLFTTCWSELMHLATSGIEHTGSLILLPDYDTLSDVRRFTDMNLQRPLEWLGIAGDYEITSMQRQSPAIRVLYKLADMPSLDDREEDDSED